MREWVLQMLAAGAGTAGLAVFFGVPGKQFFPCGLIGAAGWLVYLLADAELSPALAAFTATAFVMFMSRLLAVMRRCPATVFLIPGIIPLVPGAGIYWAAYYMVTGELDLAGKNGLQAVQIAAAIVLGIVIVSELPQGLFARSVRGGGT